MKRQIAKVFSSGTWRIIYDDQKKINPYRVTRNNLKEIDYADFRSCMEYIMDTMDAENVFAGRLVL